MLKTPIRNIKKHMYRLNTFYIVIYTDPFAIIWGVLFGDSITFISLYILTLLLLFGEYKKLTTVGGNPPLVFINGRFRVIEVCLVASWGRWRIEPVIWWREVRGLTTIFSYNDAIISEENEYIAYCKMQLEVIKTW